MDSAWTWRTDETVVSKPIESCPDFYDAVRFLKTLQKLRLETCGELVGRVIVIAPETGVCASCVIAKERERVDAVECLIDFVAYLVNTGLCRSTVGLLVRAH